MKSTEEVQSIADRIDLATNELAMFATWSDIWTPTIDQ